MSNPNQQEQVKPQEQPKPKPNFYQPDPHMGKPPKMSMGKKFMNMMRTTLGDASEIDI